MSLVRVFRLPLEYPKGYVFHASQPVYMELVDWFRNDPETYLDGKEPTQQMSIDFIKTKRYYQPDRAYLVMSPEYSFTINYEAP